jgi:hypothetical protein
VQRETQQRSVICFGGNPLAFVSQPRDVVEVVRSQAERISPASAPTLVVRSLVS